jgi:fermentation-respiration switch protein FrsA (DUF1100 family)
VDKPRDLLRWRRRALTPLKSTDEAKNGLRAGRLQNLAPPVLFIHGDDDRNVPFQQATDIG